MRRFVKDQRTRHPAQLLQTRAPPTRTRREEPAEEKFIRRQATRNQRCNQRTWTRHRYDRDTVFNRRTRETKPGIADGRRSGVGNNRDVVALLQKLAQFARALLFVVFVITAGLRVEAVML